MNLSMSLHRIPCGLSFGLERTIGDSFGVILDDCAFQFGCPVFPRTRMHAWAYGAQFASVKVGRHEWFWSVVGGQVACAAASGAEVARTVR